jgi:hypothetical protein
MNHRKMVWPDAIIGYRVFVDQVCRAIFEDGHGQYVCNDGRERIYGVYIIPEANNRWTAIFNSDTEPQEDLRGGE